MNSISTLLDDVLFMYIRVYIIMYIQFHMLAI